MSAVTDLFSYNRENFKFNKEQRQKNLYFQQNMRVRQVLLYRQDLRDLFELTIGKMDSYMVRLILPSPPSDLDCEHSIRRYCN